MALAAALAREEPAYVVAYLDVPAGQRAWIQAIRRRHDPQYAVIEPHVTLVFGVRGLTPGAWVGHVAATARETAPIRWRCGCALVGLGHGPGQAHAFLVPDEGLAETALLHGRLYRGPLQPQRRADRPYLPHVTVATTAGCAEAQGLCDELNAGGIAIDGWLSALVIGALRDGRFVELERFPLTGG